MCVLTSLLFCHFDWPRRVLRFFTWSTLGRDPDLGKNDNCVYDDVVDSYHVSEGFVRGRFYDVTKRDFNLSLTDNDISLKGIILYFQCPLFIFYGN